VLRAGENGHPERGGLEQVMAADRHQAPADERRIGRRIEILELT
jgi:hypothetical protein